MITDGIRCLYRKSGTIAPQVVTVGERKPVVRKEVLETAQKVLLVMMVFIVLTIVYLSWQALRPPGDTTALGLPSPVPTNTPVPTGEPPPKVGIVAGHYGSDSGAVCPDGLTEVEINLAIAQLVKVLLENQGHEVDLLEEFDEALDGHVADALVSIHADSCNIPEASGFKAARVLHSTLPEKEDQLVECLREEYQEATGLPFHEHSITYHMREYHAFYEIDPQTPAAIIETGFMAADRQILLNQQDKVARGIANGIVRFLETESD